MGKRFPPPPQPFACGCACRLVVVGIDQGYCASKGPTAVGASLAKIEKPWSRALSLKSLEGPWMSG